MSEPTRIWLHTPSEGEPIPPHSLRAVLRLNPLPAPEDSIGRALNLMREYAVDVLPVTHQGYHVGTVSREAILRFVGEAEDLEVAKRAAVQVIMGPAEEIVPPNASIETLRAQWKGRASGPLPALPVVDEGRYCLGFIQPLDLFFEEPFQYPKLPPIGGMATLFGVYLTDGRVQAGASNSALILTGAFMGAMILASFFVTRLVLRFAEFHFPWAPSWVFNLDAGLNCVHPWWSACAVCVRSLVVVPYLLLMRFSILAGYHAAEHQTVHALERREPLVPEVVRRMPRVHPRCGTNLVAGVGLFVFLLQLMSCFPLLQDASFLVAGLVTLFTWRQVGAFLQTWFTTRPASERELAKGIAAGNQLVARYWQSHPSRPRFWRRLWCMGLLQALLGMGGVALLASLIPSLQGLLR